jgi:FkbM family methyltransferase
MVQGAGGFQPLLLVYRCLISTYLFMSLKLYVRKSVQGILPLFPASLHRYLLSCYHNVPSLTLKTGFQVLQSLFEARSDTLSSSPVFLANNKLFRSIVESTPSPVVFDIGANIGQTSSAYVAIFPGARIHAFEPFAENFAHLRETTKSFPNVHSHRIAMSNRDGTMEVRRDHHPLSQWNSISSSYQDTLAERGEFTMESLQLERGESFCDRNSISEICLLKVDTEGHEMEVLNGFEGLFKRSAIQCVLVEVGFGADSIHGSFQEVNEFLVGHEMFLCGFYDADFKDDGTTNYANAIYCHSKHLPD